MSTRFSLRPEKFQLIPALDGTTSWVIIEITGVTFKIAAGPYISKEEAEVDLRILRCEQE